MKYKQKSSYHMTFSTKCFKKIKENTSQNERDCLIQSIINIDENSFDIIQQITETGQNELTFFTIFGQLIRNTGKNLVFLNNECTNKP